MGGRYLIILRFEEDDTENSKMTTIAHEIAHVYRDILRESEESISFYGGIGEEMATDDLCEEWGFGRSYKSYDNVPENLNPGALC